MSADIKETDLVKGRQTVNTLRTAITKDLIRVDFGEMCKSKDKNEDITVEIKSKIEFSPEYLEEFIIYLLQTGIRYEKKFDKDIGFKNIVEE